MISASVAPLARSVTVRKVLSWLDGVASSPSEKLKKNRLREWLRK